MLSKNHSRRRIVAVRLAAGHWIVAGQRVVAAVRRDCFHSCDIHLQVIKDSVDGIGKALPVSNGKQKAHRAEAVGLDHE